jgi:hypothetical protein
VGHHIGEVVDWREFFPVTSIGQAHSRPQAHEAHILYISRRGFGQECAFWESHRYVSFCGGYPQNPSFLDPDGDFQFKCLRAYLGKAEMFLQLILVTRMGNCQALFNEDSAISYIAHSI